MRIIHLLAAGAATIAVAVPATAQTPYAYPYAQPYSQPVPQPYPGQPGYGYAQQGYAQPYGTNPVEQIVNQLLGNNTRYNVTDRNAVSRCASAAVNQAQAQYRPAYRGYAQPYGQAYGYGQQYGQPYNPQYGYANAQSQMRVTEITDVQRRSNSGLRVQGLIASGAYAAPYGNAYGYQGQRYADPRFAQQADLSFRCNVDYRGAVSGVRVSRYQSRYGR